MMIKQAQNCDKHKPPRQGEPCPGCVIDALTERCAELEALLTAAPEANNGFVVAAEKAEARVAELEAEKTKRDKDVDWDRLGDADYLNELLNRVGETGKDAKP